MIKNIKLNYLLNLVFAFIIIGCSSKNSIIGNYIVKDIIYRPTNEYIELTSLNSLNVISIKENNYCKIPGFGYDNNNCNYKLFKNKKGKSIEFMCNVNSFAGVYNIFQKGSKPDSLILENELYCIIGVKLH